MFDNIAAQRAFVRRILNRPEEYSWTVQGFGMIRTYLDNAKRWRLNIWDDRLMVPNVSLIHDHPWDFDSLIISGELHNRRYDARFGGIGYRPTHNYCNILTGEGGGMVDQISKDALLVQRQPEVYYCGESYNQQRDEIHETYATRGTVTLNDRTPATKAHTARVFWPLGQKWVDAEPREATSFEILSATAVALRWLPKDEMEKAA